MYYDYEIKYMVEYQQIYYNSRFNSYSEFDIDIIHMYKLFEFKDDSEQVKAAVIEQQKWKNIALITASKGNLDKLIRNGAKVVEPQHLYSTRTDALLQMAYVCSKYLIPPEDIYSVTNGLFNASLYKKLVSHFYEEFPEKYI